jgi:hypothetical protein
MNSTTMKVWYLRNGDIEQVVAGDQAMAMQLLGSMSGYIGELLPQLDPAGQLRQLASEHPGTIFTKRYDEPVSAWAKRVTV